MFRHDSSYNIRFIFTDIKPHIFRIPQNQNIENTPSRCLNVASLLKVLRSGIVSLGWKGKACKQHHCRLILYIIRLPSYESDSWRRYTLIGVFWCVERREELVQPCEERRGKLIAQQKKLSGWWMDWRYEKTINVALSQLSQLWNLGEQRWGGGGDFKAITCEKNCNEGPTFYERSWLLYKPLFSD